MTVSSGFSCIYLFQLCYEKVFQNFISLLPFNTLEAKLCITAHAFEALLPLPKNIIEFFEKMFFYYVMTDGAK